MKFGTNGTKKPKHDNQYRVGYFRIINHLIKIKCK